jgi:hypothetical protein
MDSKWPFMLISVGLLFLLGLLISKLERSSVMKNWDKRRCEFAVMTAGAFFKPKDDPRTSTDFAADNFTFCMKSYVDKFMQLAMLPFQAIFSKHMGIANDGMNILNTMRHIASSMYNAFLDLLEPFFKRFTYATYEISRIIQYLRMAFRRLNAVVVNTLYQGLTMFRGMINTIQFVIKVIMIICGILLAIIIILIFILFPFIPMILAVLGAIVATILGIIMVVAGSVDSAVSMKKGFCFAEDSLIKIKRNNKYITVKVKDVKIGDELAENCGIVTTVIEMDGKEVPLYNINGINVSGSHVVKGKDGIWKLVEDDSRAIKIDDRSNILYCFNTTSHKIPIIGTDNEIMIFRDWEELDDEDDEGHLLWNYMILNILNKSKEYDIWKNGVKSNTEIGLMSENTKIRIKNGYKDIKSIKIGDKILNSKNEESEVLGVINGEINGESESEFWKTDLISLESEMESGKSGVWKRINGNVKSGNGVLYGKTLITDSGHFIIMDMELKTEKIVRDFTDIGYNNIHQTYPMVSERLRIFKNT